MSFISISCHSLLRNKSIQTKIIRRKCSSVDGDAKQPRTFTFIEDYYIYYWFIGQISILISALFGYEIFFLLKL